MWHTTAFARLNAQIGTGAADSASNITLPAEDEMAHVARRGEAWRLAKQRVPA
jgi:hypothetical protein